MIAKTYTCSLLGIDAILVEVDLASGLPGFATVGLPDNIVKAPCCKPDQALKQIYGCLRRYAKGIAKWRHDW
jgi:hypothetical protein